MSKLKDIHRTKAYKSLKAELSSLKAELSIRDDTIRYLRTDRDIIEKEYKTQIDLHKKAIQETRNQTITNWVQSIADLNNSIARALGEGLKLTY